MSDARPIYLDYAATTPVDPRVAQQMSACLTADGNFGNPASSHRFGRDAQALVDAARSQVAALLNAGARDVVFTSGATEADNLALLGIARAARSRAKHVITSRIEHKAVLDPCRQLEREGVQVTYLEPDGDGLIDPGAVRAALRAETVLVSIMQANNEIGVLQDIAGIGALCRERGVPLHVDAAQSVGKVPIDLATLPVDLLSFTAHKLYGPKGIGALYVRGEWRASIQPLQFGGGHERGLRSGTLPVHQIVGCGRACELARLEGGADAVHIGALRERLWAGLRDLPGVMLNGHATQRLAGILNLSFPGVEGASLMLALQELALSSSAACDSDSGEPSYVLRSLGRDSQLAQASLRFSLGRFTTDQEVDQAIAAVRREYLRLRSIAP